MAEETRDPGIGSSYEKKTRRVINKDGSFNVKRMKSNRAVSSAYQRLINMKRGKFILWVLAWYIGINLFFALVYFLLGRDQIGGLQPDEPLFLQSFYFSVQTFTTLGYGHLYPVGTTTSLISSFEAMIGLLAFALFTGLVYGRFSRPTAQILYSDKAVVAPYRGGKSLQFKVVNARSNVLMEMEATVILLIREERDGHVARHYYELDLEMDRILFFALTWTLVHPINKDSPLYGMTLDDIEEGDAEFLILLKGFDDSFSQFVYSRQSFTWKEIVWGGSYRRNFKTTDDGEILLNVDELDEFDRVDV